MKSVLLLCLLLAGVFNAHAVNYEWVKTSLSDLQTDDVVVIADESFGFALPYDRLDFEGAPVTFDSNKITGTVSEGIQWKLRKNSNNTVTFFKNNTNVPLVVSGGELKVGGSGTHEFTYNSGQLSCTTGSTTYYIYWWEDNSGYYAKLSTDANQTSRTDFAFYKRVEVQAPKYVKWKMVDGSNVKVANNDIVVIVDRNTGLAMSNDKADKDPDAVAVKLNYDKDRIIGDVDEKLLWTYTATDNGFKFAAADGNLYADGEKLKVGSDETNNVFSTTTIDGVKYLKINTGEKDYLAGVEESMFSNTWKLKELKDGKPDDKVKDTRFAIFKKVEDEQSIPTLSFPCDNYEIYMNAFIDAPFAEFEKATCEEGFLITYSSSDESVAQVDYLDYNNKYLLAMHKRGTIKLIARVEETSDHDKTVAVCTVRMNVKNDTDKGTKDNPLTPSEAISLAKGELTGYTLVPNRCYFIKGKVNKVNSGMLAMFGDMGLDEMMGDDMDMDERMGDMDDMDMSEMGDMMGGMDFMSMIPGFANSDGLTYYISDDGTKDNRLKVTDGRGLVTLTNTNDDQYQRATFEKLEDLSPGDDVLVYGPLEVSEDKNMFSDLFGGMGTGTGIGTGTGTGTGTETETDTEDKRTVKVGELNYLHDIRRVLQVPPFEGNETPHMYENTSKSMSNTDHDFFYNIYTGSSEKGLINNPVNHSEEIMQPSLKSADEEIAKWVYTDDTQTDSIFAAVEKGKTKITVKVKVVVSPAEGDNKEKYYTMKRKFNLEVRPRDKEPEGKNVGEYVLIKEGDEIEDGTRLLIVGTRTKEDADDTNYILSENSSMMGGGKGGTKLDNDKITESDKFGGRECIQYNDVPEGVLEIILEKAEDGTSWYLNVGQDENGDKLYLYASDTSEDEEEGEEDDEEEGNKFDFAKIMEMFSPSSGMKVGTMAGTGADSLKATISISNDIATIKYTATEGKNNTIVLCSSFDMDSMMEMFGGFGGNENNEEEPTEEEPTEDENTFSMGSFDMFMASFNTKKKEADDKNFLPRIFGFVQYDEYPVNIGSSEWMTIVSDYDVIPEEGVEVYVVTDVTQDQEQNTATLYPVENLKGGEPYLLHRTNTKEEYIMTRSEAEVQEPETNLLQVSDGETTGERGNTSVYVLADKTKGVGFYKWVGGKLGAGRVYLPIGAGVESPAGFCAFYENIPTVITDINPETLSDDRYYDLQGRRVSKLTKGVYVVNGKKVIIQ